MRRRDFIQGIVGSAAAWPLAAHAQQRGRTGRIGALMMYPDNDPQGAPRATVFRRELEKAGWIIGGDLQIDFHWGTGDGDWVRSAAAQVLSGAPDVMLANGDAAVKAAQHATQTVPIFHRQRRSGRRRPGAEPRPSGRQPYRLRGHGA